MNTDEMRELDAWIRDNIPGTPSNANPTRNPAAAMEVLDKIRESGAVVVIHGDKEVACSQIGGQRNGVIAETLPLAICLFAKELFK